MSNGNLNTTSPLSDEFQNGENYLEEEFKILRFYRGYKKEGVQLASCSKWATDEWYLEGEVFFGHCIIRLGNVPTKIEMS
jgi:hypothetical protein